MIKVQGFTLVELLMTLAIAGILLGIALPTFRTILIRTTITTQTNELVTAFSLARNEAIKRGVRVTVCKSGNPTAASPTCSTTAGWHEGFLVFVDNTQVAGNTRGVIDGTDTILRVFGPYVGTTITVNSSFARALSYLPSGWSKGIDTSGSDAASSGNMDLCRSNAGRRIGVTTTGRISTSVLSSC